MRVSTWETGLAGQSRNLFHSGCEPPPQSRRACILPRALSVAASCTAGAALPSQKRMRPRMQRGEQHAANLIFHTKCVQAIYARTWRAC